MNKFSKHTFSLIFLFTLPSISYAGGDDLVKTWKNKQEAYYNGETLVEKNTLEAIDKMKSLLKKYKWPASKKVSMLHKLADLHLNAGRISENKSSGTKTSPHTLKALRLYKTIIEAYPNYSKIEFVLFNNGFELFMKKKYSSAHRTLSILNKRFPRSKFTDDVYVIRADSHFELKQYKSALNLYEKAINSSNTDLAIYSRYRKSWSLFNLKRYNQAYENLFNLAKDDRQKETKNLYSTGEAMADLPRFFQKQSKKKDASHDFITVAGLKKSEDLLFELSELYFEDGDWNKSSNVFNTLIARFPKSKMIPVYHLKNGIALSTKDEIINSSLEINKGLKTCKSKLCSSIAQDEIFKLVNDWETHWRKKPKATGYAKALATVYPSLAEVTEDKKEKSKIYLLLADVEYASKNFKKASYAFEQAYKTNPEASYARQSKWAAIESLMKLEGKKLSATEVNSLANLVTNFIYEFPKDKRSITGQNFLAKVYRDTNQPGLASELYKKVSEKHLYTNTGAEAYNNYLKIKVEDKDYKSATQYLLNLKKIDEKNIKEKLISNDLDEIYTEWAEKLAKEKKIGPLISVYDQALTHRSSSTRKKDWLWNKSLGLTANKSYKKAALSFSLYEKEFGNSDGKRIEALNNSLVSYKKARMYKEASATASKLIQYDRTHRNDWLIESANIHIITKKYMKAFEVLSQVSREHPEKNIAFERLLKKLNKKELDKIRRSNLNSFSGDSVGELLLKLIYKIDDIKSQETKTAALGLRSVNANDKNYNAKGHYVLALFEHTKFESIKYSITSNLQRSLDKMIKRVMNVDSHYREAVALGSGSTQTKAILGLANLYLTVVEKYTEYAKNRLKAKKNISDVYDLVTPFIEQSLVFCNEANASLKGIDNRRSASKLKSKIKNLNKRVKRFKSWYEKNTQVNLAQHGSHS